MDWRWGAKARGEVGFQGKLGMMVLGDALSSALHRPALGKLTCFQNSSPSGRCTGPSFLLKGTFVLIDSARKAGKGSPGGKVSPSPTSQESEIGTKVCTQH